jgi:hypothetical protein
VPKALSRAGFKISRLAMRWIEEHREMLVVDGAAMAAAPDAGGRARKQEWCALSKQSSEVCLTHPCHHLAPKRQGRSKTADI